MLKAESIKVLHAFQLSFIPSRHCLQDWHYVVGSRICTKQKKFLLLVLFQHPPFTRQTIVRYISSIFRTILSSLKMTRRKMIFWLSNNIRFNYSLLILSLSDWFVVWELFSCLQNYKEFIWSPIIFLHKYKSWEEFEWDIPRTESWLLECIVNSF